MQANATPPEIFTHIVRKEMSVDTLIGLIYDRPSPATVAHFKFVNDHLKDNRVQPGQLVIISPPDSQQCTPFETSLGELARRVDERLAAMKAAERQVLAQRYEVLNAVTQYSGVGYGVGMTYLTQHKKHVEAVLREIERTYVQTYKKYGKLNGKDFLSRRKALFMRLNTALDRMIGEKAMGLDIDGARLRRSLGLSSKSIITQWKKQPGAINGIPGFEKNYAKWLKAGGYVGIALDVGQSGLNIHEACTTGREQACARTKYREGGRLVGSIGGGVAGGYLAAYGVCNMVLGLETAGTSLLWCAIIVGGTGGYFGSQIGGKKIGDVGEVVYEYTAPAGY